MSNPQIQLYTSSDGKVTLEVTQDAQTLWLTQAQMADLFGTRRPAITKHLGNIFRSGELDQQVVCSVLEHTTQHGALEGRTQTGKLRYYNLDAIISVGYRVNSNRATQFRIWATQVLKQHLIEGYTLNQRRLQEHGVEFEQALSLLSRTLDRHALVAPEGRAVLTVISDYARSWALLQGYDEKSLGAQTATQTDMRGLALDDALKAIHQLKAELIRKGEATPLFGQIRNAGLASALATIEQGFSDELFYPNVASRAAHLLYFVIKNHPLVDGNKRTGSFLFLWYLRLNQHLLARPVEALINDNTLVALALLVAESLPEQKTLMVRLIEHFVLLKQEL
jgi:prophage maintenance system killer protein